MPVHFRRPTDRHLFVERTQVDGDCPACRRHELHRYPVLCEDGWFDVVKCAHCLTSISRQPGPKLGPVELLSDFL